MDILNLNICIIGAGKLGLSFADYFLKRNCNFTIAVRSDNSYLNAKKILPDNIIIRNIESIPDNVDFVFLTVRDSEIKHTAEILAEKFKSKLIGKYIAHCSGMLASDELQSCKNFGAKIVTLHPYQTFYNYGADTFKGIPWGIEGDTDNLIIDFINFMGGTPHTIDKQNKIMYHISAVAMSNYLNTAVYLGKLCSREAGITPEEFAPIIIHTTLNNLLSNKESNNNTLTGPIARSDLSTVKTHIEELKSHPELLKPYCYMGLATLELANNSGIITADYYDECRQLFEENIN